MGLDVNDCIKALKYEQDIQKVADSMFQLKEKAPGKSSGAKTSGNSMEEQGDGESETDDGSQEDETDSNPEWPAAETLQLDFNHILFQYIYLCDCDFCMTAYCLLLIQLPYNFVLFLNKIYYVKYFLKIISIYLSIYLSRGFI